VRYLQIVHAIPGRTRLRCPTLRHDRDQVECAADALAAVAGVHEVKIRPYTGSILVLHEAAVTPAMLVAAAQQVLACERVVQRGEQPPTDDFTPELSKIARLAAAAFRDLDRDVLRRSEGSLDLGVLATLGFLGAGAVQLAIEREVELPQWFNLAWWGYRTFMTNEADEIASVHDRPGSA
jgi:hypothetical protein